MKRATMAAGVAVNGHFEPSFGSETTGSLETAETERNAQTGVRSGERLMSSLDIRAPHPADIEGRGLDDSRAGHGSLGPNPHRGRLAGGAPCPPTVTTSVCFRTGDIGWHQLLGVLVKYTRRPEKFSLWCTTRSYRDRQLTSWKINDPRFAKVESLAASYLLSLRRLVRLMVCQDSARAAASQRHRPCFRLAARRAKIYLRQQLVRSEPTIGKVTQDRYFQCSALVPSIGGFERALLAGARNSRCVTSKARPWPPNSWNPANVGVVRSPAA
jgi:hypothetical protein